LKEKAEKTTTRRRNNCSE